MGIATKVDPASVTKRAIMMDVSVRAVIAHVWSAVSVATTGVTRSHTAPESTTNAPPAPMAIHSGLVIGDAPPTLRARGWCPD